MFKYLNKGISTPIAIAVILLLAVLVGGITLWQYSEMQKEEVKLSEIEISKNGEEPVATFKECAVKGYPVLESYPRQCKTPDGKTFTEKIEKEAEENSIKEDSEGLSWKEQQEIYRELTALAEKNEDESFCEKIPPEKLGYYREKCYIYLSKLKDDVSLCKKLDYPDPCNDYFKEKEKNTSPIYVNYQDMPDWKVYENQEYGFEAKYPLKIIEVDNTKATMSFTLFCEGIYFNYSVVVSDNSSQLPLRLWIQKYEWCGEDTKPYGKDVIVAGTEGVRIDSLGCCPPGSSGISNIVYLSKGLKIYQIKRSVEGATGSGKECFIEPEELFNRMLSTFKFLD